MDRSKQFVDNFKKVTDMLRDNKPEGMAFYVFIYARDIKARDDENTDGKMNTESLAKLSNFDKYWIKERISEDLLSI